MLLLSAGCPWGRAGWSFQLESRAGRDGRSVSFNPGHDIPAPWGNWRASHILCVTPTSCPHSRHAGKRSSVTVPQPWPPGPLLPCLGTGLAAAAKKGDGRAHTPSRLLCSCPAGAKASSVIFLSHAAHQTSDGRGTHPCAVPLAENTGFIIWPTWDAAGEQRRQHVPHQLSVPGVSNQRRARHMGSSSAVSSRHNRPKPFPPWQSQNGKLVEPITKPIIIDKLQRIGTPLVSCLQGRNQGSWEDPQHPHLTPDTDHIAECST